MTDRPDFPHSYDGLSQLVRHLRAPDGCPWDREQTPSSLRPLLLEECYELIEAIDEGDTDGLIGELGDVLFHVVLQVQIADEAGLFSQGQVMQALIQKLVRRHPHVFADTKVADAREVKANWEVSKQRERGRADASTLDGVPKSMPALSYAHSVQQRAARTGFDWEDFPGALDKVTEELAEIASARSAEETERELGDLLFSIVNAARWMGVEPEGALRQANARFYARFAAMEKLSRDRNLAFRGLSLDEKESLWQEAKALEG